MTKMVSNDLLLRLLLEEFPQEHVALLLSKDSDTLTWVANYGYKSKLVRALSRYHCLIKLQPKKAKIPRSIVQFWNDDPPDDVACLIDSWRNIDGWDHQLFDDHTGRAFILKNFGRDAVEAFDFLDSPTFRCDLFRYCYLAVNGGFYIDADEKRREEGTLHLPLDAEVIMAPRCWIFGDYTRFGVDHPEVRVPAALELGITCSEANFYLNNSPLGSVPGHSLFKGMAEKSISIILNGKKIGERPDLKTTTSPVMWTEFVLSYLLKEGVFESIQNIALTPFWLSLIAVEVGASYKSTDRYWGRS